MWTGSLPFLSEQRPHQVVDPAGRKIQYPLPFSLLGGGTAPRLLKLGVLRRSRQCRPQACADQGLTGRMIVVEHSI